MALIYCPECGNQTSDQAEACNKCGYPISKLNFNQKQSTSNLNTVTGSSSFIGLDSYYQQEFEEIQKSNEVYRGKFNWYAFLFSWIWLFVKGAWGYGLILLIINLGLNAFLFNAKNIGSLIFVFIIFIGVHKFLGHNATKIFYNVKVKNKQF